VTLGQPWGVRRWGAVMRDFLLNAMFHLAHGVGLLAAGSWAYFIGPPLGHLAEGTRALGYDLRVRLTGCIPRGLVPRHHAAGVAVP
jgi:hypothetical protein